MDTDNEYDSDGDSVETDDSNDTVDDTPFIAYIDDDILCEYIETGIRELITVYVEEHPGTFLKKGFFDTLIRDVAELAIQPCIESGVSVSRTKMEHYVEICAHEYFQDSVYPLREMSVGAESDTEPIPDTTARVDELVAHFAEIANTYQPVQRTPEWYAYRQTMLTASNISKAIGSPAERNSLIFEKCSPVSESIVSRIPINVNNPMHHGIKYEPLTAMLYETIYNTKMSEFGCLRHPAYPFIGASPDGIITDPVKPRFGRMVEIKNIVNREITGIPSAMYWVQMQIQMEVFGLCECDFVETRFCEYATREACLEDTDRRWRGVVLHFTEMGDTKYSPNYVFSPLDMCMDDIHITEWIADQITERENTHELYGEAFWYNDQFSCVCIHKNAAWIRAAIPEIAELWATIETERETGYEHRRPKPRAKVAPKEISMNSTRITTVVKMAADYTEDPEFAY